jgi:hypothetical protein
MKIAVSGTAGVGKTVLCKSLAPLLKLEYIAENYEPFFDKKGIFSGSPEKLIPVFYQVLKDKQKLEQESGDFITDRCPVDLFHMWMTKGLDKDEAATAKFFNHCLIQTRSYDYILLPAWGSLKLQQKTDRKNQQVRVMNAWTQLRNHAGITGYIHLWVPPVNIIQLPMSLSDHDQRIRFVLEQIKLRNARDRSD